MTRTVPALMAIFWLACASPIVADEPIGAEASGKLSRDFLDEADVVYQQPAATPVAGQPVGNGRMGTMVWTSSSAIHLQINRNDVFAVNRNHAGSQFGPVDYCGGIARIVVDVGGSPFVADGNTFRQRLSLETAECGIEGHKLNVSCFVASRSRWDFFEGFGNVCDVGDRFRLQTAQRHR